MLTSLIVGIAVGIGFVIAWKKRDLIKAWIIKGWGMIRGNK